MFKNSDTALYSSPFCRGYWKSALGEFRNTRSFVLAALFVALRVAIKSLSIPVAEGLHISIDFFVNSVGSMIYGPLMGLLVGACSDTVGAVLFPTGTYFFPFIFVEMLSSFLFGLFLYRAHLSELRIVLSRFAVTALANLLLNPIIMKWYYIIVLGKDYTLFRWARIMKNLVMFPAEVVLLTVWLSVISAATYRLHLTYDNREKIRLTAKTVIPTVILTLLAVAAVVYYLWVQKNQ